MNRLKPDAGRQKHGHNNRLLGWILPVFLAMLVALAGTATGAPYEADVCVYGGTSAGVIAAVQAARLGQKVVLIEPGRHLGGMTSSGLGMTDNGNTDTIGGLSCEFYQRVYRYYTNASAWKFQAREAFVKWLPQTWGVDGPRMEQIRAQFRFEPHAAEAVFNELAREAKVQVILGERLELKNGVRKNGPRIVSIAMESGREFGAKVFIDASYEGDLMARAGVKYIVGREPNSLYGETLNGAFPFTPRGFPNISPYIVPNDPKSGLLPRIESKPPGPKGTGDHRVQTYNFRVCLTDVPENRVPFAKPKNYNPLDYELLARHIATLKNVKPGPRPGAAMSLRGGANDLGLNFDLVPNRKTDSNSGGEFGSDLVGRSYGWAEADYAGRARLWQEHKNYTLGLLWFLANDPRVPEPVRAEMQRWGLAKDEFADNGNWPWQLYVREARRMVSDYVITENDARGSRVAEDAVALASYPLDSHGVTLYVDEAGQLWRERGFFEGISPFPISYQALRPRAGECDNLLVTCCLSASHAAYGSVRMEPVFMMIGQAAGTAASLATDAKVSVQALPYPVLRERLLADRVILATRTPRPAGKAAATDSPTITPDPQLAADLKVLVEKGITNSADYWLANARKRARCQGELVESLILGMANSLEPVKDRDDALRVLAARKVITSPAFWSERAAAGKDCPGEFVATIIHNFVRASAAASQGKPPRQEK